MAPEAVSPASAPALTVREASSADAAVLAELRLEFMSIIKNGGIEDEEQWREWLISYFKQNLSAGRIRAWLCFDEGNPVASAVLKIAAVRRSRGGPGKYDGIITNVYTRPGYRRIGIAHALLESLIAEARRRGLRRLLLNPREDGRVLYEALGFRPFRDVMILSL